MEKTISKKRRSSFDEFFDVFDSDEENLHLSSTRESSIQSFFVSNIFIEQILKLSSSTADTCVNCCKIKNLICSPASSDSSFLTALPEKQENKFIIISDVKINANVEEREENKSWSGKGKQSENKLTRSKRAKLDLNENQKENNEVLDGNESHGKIYQNVEEKEGNKSRSMKGNKLSKSKRAKLDFTEKEEDNNLSDYKKDSIIASKDKVGNNLELDLLQFDLDGNESLSKINENVEEREEIKSKSLKGNKLSKSKRNEKEQENDNLSGGDESHGKINENAEEIEINKSRSTKGNKSSKSKRAKLDLNEKENEDNNLSDYKKDSVIASKNKVDNNFKLDILQFDLDDYKSHGKINENIEEREENKSRSLKGSKFSRSKRVKLDLNEKEQENDNLSDGNEILGKINENVEERENNKSRSTKGNKSSKSKRAKLDLNEKEKEDTNLSDGNESLGKINENVEEREENKSRSLRGNKLSKCKRAKLDLKEKEDTNLSDYKKSSVIASKDKADNNFELDLLQFDLDGNESLSKINENIEEREENKSRSLKENKLSKSKGAKLNLNEKEDNILSVANGIHGKDNKSVQEREKIKLRSAKGKQSENILSKSRRAKLDLNEREKENNIIFNQLLEDYKREYSITSKENVSNNSKLDLLTFDFDASELNDECNNSENQIRISGIEQTTKNTISKSKMTKKKPEEKLKLNVSTKKATKNKLRKAYRRYRVQTEIFLNLSRKFKFIINKQNSKKIDKRIFRLKIDTTVNRNYYKALARKLARTAGILPPNHDRQKEASPPFKKDEVTSRKILKPARKLYNEDMWLHSALFDSMFQSDE